MRPHLMIVDDSPDQLLLVERIFRMVDPGIEIITAGDGDEAMDILLANPLRKPKVILLDLRMPKKNGHEVLAEIKAHPDLKTIPVCTFSNGDLESDVRASYEGGASFYFRKPSGIDDLKRFATQFRGIWFDFASHCP